MFEKWQKMKKKIHNIRANSIKNGAFVEKNEDVNKYDRFSEFHPK